MDRPGVWQDAIKYLLHWEVNGVTKLPHGVSIAKFKSMDNGDFSDI
jgi:hypothetical protein